MSSESDQRRIVVTVDAELEDLIPGFLENRRQDVEKINESLAAGDFATICVLGHSMKGSGGGYGFDAISSIGRRIEDAARSGDVDVVAEAVRDLADYLDRIDVVFA
jgi:HPt (histidine-containing phosphotransfer) domain-containing protein